ncbi:MAG: flagellar hook-length control protein FliK [Lachnospiraceae bacterium]|nr:flagellar hook-length control protein FliK [Lachnospiraceae bacterium]
MTSANVSSVPIQAGPVLQSVSKSEKMEGDKNFLQLMNESMKSDVNNISYNTKTSSMKVDRISSQAPSATTDNIKKDIAKIDRSQKDVIDGGKVEELKESVDEFEDGVKKLLTEELDVSEEDIENAMEELGLTFLDLTDVQNLAKLVTDLTDADNSISLVLNENFNNILTQVKEMAQDLMQTVELDLETISKIFDTVEGNMPIDNAFDQTFINTGDNKLAEDETLVVNISNNDASVKTEDIAVNIKADATNVENVEADVLQKQQDAMVSNVETKSVEGQKVMVNDNDDEPEIETNVETVIKDAATEGTEILKDNQTNLNSNNNHRQMEFNDNSKAAEQVVVNETSQPFTFDSSTNEVTMPDGQRVYVRDMIDQIATQVRTTITQDSKTMEMILNPEGLGKIYMEVSEKEGNVTAKLYTENQIVKEALESQMITLREQINNSNSKVTSIEVSVATHEFEKNLEEGQQERQEESAQQNNKSRTRNINLNNLDELAGLMTEEEELVAQIMRDNGNTVNLEA